MNIKNQKIISVLIAGGKSRRFGGGIKTLTKINGESIFEKIIDVLNKQNTKILINSNYKNEVFNLGNNKSENLLDMISYLEDAIGKKAIMDFLPIQPGDVKETFADIEKSKKMLDFSPSTDLVKGINKFVIWYNDFYSTRKNSK